METCNQRKRSRHWLVFIIAVQNGAIQFGYFEFLEGIGLACHIQINKELTPEKIKKAEALVEEMVQIHQESEAAEQMKQLLILITVTAWILVGY